MKTRILAYRFIALIFAFMAFQMVGVRTSKAGEAKPGSRAEWDKTVSAAEKEGEVVIYTTGGLDLLFRDLFQKKYPAIKVTTITGRTSELGNRIMNERRAAKHIPDVFIGGSTTPLTVLHRGKALDRIRPLLLLPEVLDESKWFQGKHHYVDSENAYIFVFEGSGRAGDITYNTNLVNPDTIKSYWDLLDPRWKGKIVSMDPLRPGPASNSQRFFYYNPEIGPEFVRRLFGQMDVAISQNDDQLKDWLAVGKFAFGLFARDPDVPEKQGLPVKQFRPNHFKEGAYVGAHNGTVSVIAQAPHPNAAKVVINWLLSREGQMKWLEYNLKESNLYDSMREDIPKDMVSPIARRTGGVKYLNEGKAEWITNMQVIYDLIKKAQKESKKE